MRKRRWITCIAVVVLLGIVALVGVLFLKSKTDTVYVQKEQSVIEGAIVAASDAPEVIDKLDNIKESEQDKNNFEDTTKDQDTEEVQESAYTGQSPLGTGQTGVQEIQSRLENLVNTEYGAGGRVAVCTGRTDESDMAMVNGGAMQAASLIKLYVAGCVYENYGLVSAHEGYSGETESLLSVMITVSDNTACNTLVTRLGNGNAQTGMACVNQYCANHGFFDTHMGRLMLQPNDVDDNYTSVRDCCNYLKMASAGQLKGASSVLGYMNQQQRRSKIPAGLPAGVPVGNKTGELSNVENDAAIVYSNSGTYVLCVMSENLSDTYSAQQFIARTSRVVYEAMQ